MSPWGWKPPRNEGIWRHGQPGLRPLVAAAPYLTLGLLILLFWVIGGTLTMAKGVLFDLPDVEQPADGALTDMVALVMPVSHETLVFFDDARFMLGDAASMRSFADQLSERASRTDRKTLLVLADRRVAGGDLMKLAALAKGNGVNRILFAEKGSNTAE